MGPVRHSHSKRHIGDSKGSTDVLPGVQKIKSSIRQTKRLLAKASGRPSGSIYRQLDAGFSIGKISGGYPETSRKERLLSTRYHKIKFFERQKVVRRINQTKKKIQEEQASSSTSTLEKDLFEYRVQLNYILVSLPENEEIHLPLSPELRQNSNDDSPSSTEPADTDHQREQVKTWIREQMNSGALAGEPEEVQQSEQKSPQSNERQWDTQTKKKKKKEKAAEVVEEQEEEDDFFE
ncbi:hypothetical protein D9757_012863 [Collybiopsis confluens]|uniref:rRNA-processing protein EFG1 n=1 Tax=Collybiopsis confluens TaxID=2823264 RepID=A0A8H5G1M3_9AGAR|nr:hypothetical protein D9757_012863 [Collybiopsis confluens]